MTESVYDMVGGEAVIWQLVDIFYDKVARDPILREMFPEDLEPGKRHQTLFLIQFFGGPSQYAEERGHPRLRMRHAPFAIDQRARDIWLGYMLDAIDELGIIDPARGLMRSYFERAASHMINVHHSGGDLL